MKQHISRRFRNTVPANVKARTYARLEAANGNTLAQQWLTNKGIRW